jgi:RNA polymerase sigma-70 factor (ECF subfamily)
MTVTAEPVDAELVARMAAGDREAFAALFRRHQASVYRFSRQMLGSRDAAEDVTQDVFIALAENARRFDSKLGSLTTYLYGITRHIILQRHKRDRGRTDVDIDAIADNDAAHLAVSGDPIEALSQAQRVELLRAAILRLPIHYREAIVLCELHDLSYEDAATVARCPVGTIRSRLSRARQMLMERCTDLARHESAARQAPRVGKKTWLIPTKNNC